MASTSPSPTASPPSVTPQVDSSPPPSTSQPDQTSDLPSPPTSSIPDSSPPPPQSSTPPPPANSPPPATQASTPPAAPVSPPPETPASPPPAPPPSPPLSPPPSPPNAPLPAANSPPPPVPSPPPPETLPSPPPPPPEASPPPPATETSPPPQESAQSPPPPAEVPASPASKSPPPPASDPPKGSPPSPAVQSPPPPYSPTSSPTPVSNPPANSSSPLLQPDFPTQKPTAKSTVGNNNNVIADDKAGGGGGMNTGGAVAIGTIVGLVVLSLAFMALWVARKKKRRGVNFGYANPSPYASQSSGSSFLRSNSPPPLLPSLSGSDSKAWFSYDELDQATGGFSTQNLLGEGGFGCVYKGVLVDGRVVAVKQLKIGGGQGEREFRAEVEIISRVHHRYLVSLVGYCISDHQRLLVYDFVSNGTLDHHLHVGEGMDWATRVKVAAGAARGIAYLHEDCHPRIIHRDIKSSNILLDNNYDAQVSDFGLAKLALDSNTHVSTRVMGTFGYLAPEYATSGKLTEKSDVYSYGVVLLELITGRKPVDASQPLGDESLVEWARPLLSEALDTQDFDELVDPRLGKNYIKTEMTRMMEAAAACVRHSATKRPRMGQVVRALVSMDDDISDLSNGVKPGQSEVFDSRRQSEVWGFDSKTHSSWASRDEGDRTRSSFGGGDYDRFQSQSSWSTREQGNQNTARPANKSALAGFWDN